MLELRHLRSLLAIIESGSLSIAAKRLHLTQSALSHQIKALESYYGLRLFSRESKPLVASQAAHIIAELARDVLPRVQAAERKITQLQTTTRGMLRIALECHTCFDWLMPVMDSFRSAWPEVDLDLVSGFHSEPLTLLDQNRADVVIASDKKKGQGKTVFPLFRFEILAVLPRDHTLTKKRYLIASDFAKEKLITYPVAPDRIDLIRRVLRPAGIEVERRTVELTIAIMQLVASRRGIAALPNWGVKNYVDYDYVATAQIGRAGLWSSLYAVALNQTAQQDYLQDFIKVLKSKCFATLKGIEPI